MKSLQDFWQSASLTQKILLSALVLYSIGILSYLFLERFDFLWDFKVYRASAQAYLKDLNPYSLSDLKSVHLNLAELPYMYPPLVIRLFIPFTLLSYSLMSIFYIVLKLVALVFLIKHWSRFFPIKNWIVPFTLFCILGFNAAIHKDLFTGNISLFEQVFLWYGLTQLLKDKLWPFALSVLFIATFKLIPLAFLGIILFVPNPKKWGVFALSLLIFALYIGLNFLLEPELTPVYLQSFFDNAIPEGGIGNASSLEFFRSLLPYFDSAVKDVWPVSFYIAFVLISSFFTLKYLQPLLRSKDEKSRIHVILSLILLIALALPRFKDYSYILIMLPVFYVAIHNLNKVGLGLLIFSLVLSVKNVTIPVVREGFELLWNYNTFILLFVSWVFCLRMSKSLN